MAANRIRSRQHDVQRRASGELEGDVLAALWAAPGPMTPAEVQEALESGLAYNTVMTVLRRLHEKGITARERSGRAYAYRPALNAADIAARKMRDALDVGADRQGVLQSFVDGLSADDERVLRELIAKAG
jgi:predicted transcriptional regulator